MAKGHYDFKDDRGHYNVRKVKGVRTKVYADGKHIAAPKATTSTPSTGGTSSSKPVLSVARYKTWSPTHQAQALKFYGDPSLTTEDFYKLPPAKQRELLARVRAGRQTAVQPGSAMAPQTVNDINVAAEAAADLKYGQAKRDFNTDIAGSDIQQGRITDWFNQYQNTLKDAAAQTQAAYNTASAGVVNQAAASEKVAADAQDKMLAAQAADAATRGGNVDPNIAAQAIQAAASRAGTANTVAGGIAGQGATAFGYDQRLRGVAANQGVQAHLAESATKKNLKNKLRDLLTEAGQFEVVQRQDLTAAERKNALETAAFKLDVQTEDDKTKQAEADRIAKDRENKRKAEEARRKREQDQMNKDREFQLDKDKYGDEQAKDRYQRRHHLGPYKPGASKDPKDKDTFLSSSAQAKVVSRIETMRNIIAQPQKWPTGPRKGQPMTRAEVINSLKNGGVLAGGTRFDPREVEVAGNLVQNKGKLGPYGVDQAHKLRLRVGVAGWGTVK